MVVAVCRLTLRVPESHSLKDKRMVLRRLRDRVRAKFDVAFAEVGDQDAWQSAQLGVALVGSDRRVLEGVLQKVIDLVNDVAEGKVVDEEREILSYGDGLGVEPGHWEPPPGPPRRRS